MDRSTEERGRLTKWTGLGEGQADEVDRSTEERGRLMKG